MNSLIENIRHNCRNGNTILAFTAGIPTEPETLDFDEYIRGPVKEEQIQQEVINLKQILSEIQSDPEKQETIELEVRNSIRLRRKVLQRTPREIRKKQLLIEGYKQKYKEVQTVEYNR